MKIPSTFSLIPPAVPSIVSWNLAMLLDASPIRPSSVSKLAIQTLTPDFLDPRLLSLVAFYSENRVF